MKNRVAYQKSVYYSNCRCNDTWRIGQNQLAVPLFWYIAWAQYGQYGKVKALKWYHDHLYDYFYCRMIEVKAGMNIRSNEVFRFLTTKEPFSLCSIFSRKLLFFF